MNIIGRLLGSISGFMMTSSIRNIFRVTGSLWGESTGHWGIPSDVASDVERWCFLWYEPKQTVEQTLETSVIWDAITLIITSKLLAVWSFGNIMTWKCFRIIGFSWWRLKFRALVFVAVVVVSLKSGWKKRRVAETSRCSCVVISIGYAQRWLALRCCNISHWV